MLFLVKLNQNLGGYTKVSKEGFAALLAWTVYRTKYSLCTLCLQTHKAGKELEW
jgi:hypothetical protein